MAAGDASAETQRAKLLAENAGTSRLIGCTVDGLLHTFAHPTLELEQDNLSNDSNKTFTVPTGETWWIHGISVNYASTATAGDRQIRLTIQPLSSISDIRILAGAVQAASLSRNYSFFPGAAHAAAFISLDIQIPLPQRLILPAASTIAILDENAVDAAADDMLVALFHSTYTP